MARALYEMMLPSDATARDRDVARKMIIAGDVLLALDGLDELARVKGEEAVKAVVRKLDSFIGGASKAKVIISCRDHILDRLQGIGVLGNDRSHAKLTIQPLGKEEMQKLLREQLGRDPGVLADIATIPLFYEMIRRCRRHLDKLPKGKANRTRLEEIWFEVMLKASASQIETGRRAVSKSRLRHTQVLHKIGRIAAAMLGNRSDILEIGHCDPAAAELIRQLSEPSFAIFEKATETTYSFSHQSLREFVLAWRVAAEIKTRCFEFLTSSSSFDYEGCEFYARVGDLLKIDVDVIPRIEQLLDPKGVGDADKWNHLVRNLFEMIGMLASTDERNVERAAKSALSYLNRKRPYVTYKTKYNIARCLERIHCTAPKQPSYCKYILNNFWAEAKPDNAHIAAHAIRGFHMETQKPGPLPFTVFWSNEQQKPVPFADFWRRMRPSKRMLRLQHEVSDALMTAFEELESIQELPEDAHFFGINCSHALMRWLPDASEISTKTEQRIQRLLTIRHVSVSMKQNIFHALYTRYGIDIPTRFRKSGVFKGIAPLSWRRNESWASAEAKEALARLSPKDSEEIWRNHKEGNPQTRAQQVGKI